MLTGELKSRIDQIWNAFWSGGIANPLEVIEQITYLLFLRGLDADQTREENKATRLKTQPLRIYPEGSDERGLPYEDMHWSRFKNAAPDTMFKANINAKEIQRVRIAMVPLALQQCFARRMRSVDKLKATDRDALAHLDELFATLQHRAFRGEL